MHFDNEFDAKLVLRSNRHQPRNRVIRHVFRPVQFAWLPEQWRERQALLRKKSFKNAKKISRKQPF